MLKLFLLSACTIVTTCMSQTQSVPTNNKVETSEYEVFATKYETLFGEKPSAKIWTLGQQCVRSCSSQQCRSGCSTKCKRK